MLLEKFALGDATIAIPPDDWMLQSVKEGAYEPYVMEAMMAAIKPHHVALDVGCNVGIFTTALAKRCRHVVAVDASPVNAKICLANLSLNGLTNATVYPVAVSDKYEMGLFLNRNESNKVIVNGSLSETNLDDFDVTMSVPLDCLLPERVDLVKIDIEGREYAALRGAERLFGMRPTIFVEFSPEFIRHGCGVTASEFLALFFQRGYQATILHRDMTQEVVGQDEGRLLAAWQDYMSRNVTHIDLMMVA